MEITQREGPPKEAKKKLRFCVKWVHRLQKNFSIEKQF